MHVSRSSPEAVRTCYLALQDVFSDAPFNFRATVSHQMHDVSSAWPSDVCVCGRQQVVGVIDVLSRRQASISVNQHLLTSMTKNRSSTVAARLRNLNFAHQTAITVLSLVKGEIFM